MNRILLYCSTYRFTVGHEDWKTLGKCLRHQLSLFHSNLTFSKVFYRPCLPLLASCYRCCKLACRETEQPKCSLLTLVSVKLLPEGAGSSSTVDDSHFVSLFPSPSSNRHMFRPCLISIPKRKESWASVVETLSKSLTILTPTGGREPATDRRACFHATT